jgi:hypothetical protein
MDMTIRKLVLAAALLGLPLFLALPPAAAAQVEVEADPLAYAAGGFSLHVAKVLGPTRLNVGVFGADIPRWVHGNDGWDSTMRGVGLKWDYIRAGSDGFFVGLEGGYMWMEYTRLSEGEGAKRDVVGLGMRAGYRFPLGERGLYIAPWAGVGYNFDGDAVVVGGEEFGRSRVMFFPTIHIGWRF